MTALCHCTHCQRQSGSAFSVNLVFLESDLRIDGQLKTFDDVGENGAPVLRRFCPNCGSPILSVLSSSPGMVALKGGTLDDRASIMPTFEVWRRSKQDWVHLSPELPGTIENPPQD